MAAPAPGTVLLQPARLRLWHKDSAFRRKRKPLFRLRETAFSAFGADARSSAAGAAGDERSECP